MSNSSIWPIRATTTGQSGPENNKMRQNHTWKHYLFALSLNVKQFYLTHWYGLSGAATPDQSEPENNANEGVLCIPQSAGIAEATLRQSLGKFYPSAEMQSAYLG